MITNPDFRFDDNEELGEILTRLSPAIVLPNWLWHTYPTCQALKDQGVQLRVVGYCRGDNEATYYRPLQDHHLACDWLVAVSSACRDGLIERFPQRHDRIRLLRTFVDRPAQLQRAWDSAPLRLVYSGRLEQLYKRVLDLVDVADKLNATGIDYELNIAGEGSAGPELRRRFSELQDPAPVHLLGMLSASELTALYLQTDVILLLSDKEGLSNALLEGMACGCVPVSTRTSRELKQLMAGELADHVVAIRDTSGAAALITRLAGNRPRLERLGRAAHAATADFGWAAYSVRFRRLLDEVEADF